MTKQGAAVPLHLHDRCCLCLFSTHSCPRHLLMRVLAEQGAAVQLYLQSRPRLSFSSLWLMWVISVGPCRRAQVLAEEGAAAWPHLQAGGGKC